MGFVRRRLAPRAIKQREPTATLDDVLAFAVAHVPYYRQFEGYDSLGDFPLLTKEIIRAHAEDLVSDDISERNWYYNTSGGSTGEPVRFIQDAEYYLRGNWVVWLTKSWVGYTPGDCLVKLWGESMEAPPPTLKVRIGKWLINITELDTFQMDERRLRSYVRLIRRKKPKLIVGYASSLVEVSRYVIDQGIEIRGVGAVVSAASTLYPEMRQTIAKAFGCDVYDRYGSREVGAIAAEDRGGHGLRVCHTVHVETVLPDGSPCAEGEMGEIIVTSLMNFAMPLIRYRIGDVGILRTIDGTRYLEKVVGRTVELFKTQDGRRVDGEYFTHLLYFRDWVQRFRFRQVALDRIAIEIVQRPGVESPLSERREVEKDIRKMIGESTRVDWKFVDEIQPLPSGKYVYTLCELD
jgi:phenylacetate-CoA ligase